MNFVTKLGKHVADHPKAWSIVMHGLIITASTIASNAIYQLGRESIVNEIATIKNETDKENVNE